MECPMLPGLSLGQSFEKRVVIQRGELQELHAVIIEGSLTPRSHPHNAGLGFNDLWLREDDEAQATSHEERSVQLETGPPLSQILGPARSRLGRFLLIQSLVEHGDLDGISQKPLSHGPAGLQLRCQTALPRCPPSPPP